MLALRKICRKSKPVSYWVLIQTQCQKMENGLAWILQSIIVTWYPAPTTYYWNQFGYFSNSKRFQLVRIKIKCTSQKILTCKISGQLVHWGLSYRHNPCPDFVRKTGLCCPPFYKIWTFQKICTCYMPEFTKWIIYWHVWTLGSNKGWLQKKTLHYIHGKNFISWYCGNLFQRRLVYLRTSE